MRIAIDVRALTNQLTGTGYYLIHLLDEFARLPDEHTYYLCSSREFKYHPPENESRFIPIIQRGLPGNLWLQWQLPQRLKELNIDLFQSPFGVIPFHSPCPTVATIHDLAFYWYPKLTDFKNRILLPRLIPKSASCATKIITDSFAVEQELHSIYRIPEDKITVIHLAAGNRFHPIAQHHAQAVLQKKYSITNPCILCIATLEPRKNIALLIKAYHRLPVELQEKFHLVLAGKKGWQYQHLFSLVKRLHLETRVMFTGYVPKEDLPFFYSMAMVFVYPSLYEGFGLPVLDAMACGTPVITLNTSSFPEIVDDAGILINPTDESALSNAILNILTNQTLQKQLSEKSLARSTLFSWKQTALKTQQVYTSAV